MSGSGSSSGDIFDVKRIRRLVELMNEHELSEVDLRQNDQRIRLRKGHDPIVTMAAPAAAPVAQASSGAAAAASGGSATKADDANTAVIKSPMVGTYYASPSPEAPPFVKVGDHVGPTTVVCVVEAMKVFNEIPAEQSGQIVAVLVENGEPVEYGQPLFKVNTQK
jgi:acetyl-CoA carboxylase biotin carboxyl carrier protein